MAGKKVSKNQMKSTGGSNKDCQVKYSDPRMAYSSTKQEMVIKESEHFKMLDIFGSEIPCCNSPIVICEDHIGYYITSKSLVNVEVLDPYRNYKRCGYTISKIDDNTFKVVNAYNVEYTI